MRTWVKWTSLATFGLLASSAIAADHADPTEVEGVDASDIADVYAWMSDANTLTMIQTITAAELSDGAYYVFNIGRQADAASAATAASTNQNLTKVICWYDTGDTTTCVVDNGSGVTVDYVQGLAADELNSTEGTLRVHVAQHADPFFFYLTGFNNARAEVLQYAAALADGPGCGNASGNSCFDANGCPDLTATHPEATAGTPYADGASDTVGGVLRGMLTGDYDADNMDLPMGAVNNLAANNVTGIVVELDTSLLAGSGDHFQVWASTHVRGE